MKKYISCALVAADRPGFRPNGKIGFSFNCNIDAINDLTQFWGEKYRILDETRVSLTVVRNAMFGRENNRYFAKKCTRTIHSNVRANVIILYKSKTYKKTDNTRFAQQNDNTKKKIWPRFFHF